MPTVSPRQASRGGSIHFFGVGGQKFPQFPDAVPRNLDAVAGQRLQERFGPDQLRLEFEHLEVGDGFGSARQPDDPGLGLGAQEAIWQDRLVFVLGPELKVPALARGPQEVSPGPLRVAPQNQRRRRDLAVQDRRDLLIQPLPQTYSFGHPRL